MTVSKPSAPVSDHWQSPSRILLMVLKQFIHNRICCLFKISTYILTKTHRTRSDIQFPLWHSPASLVRSESKWAIFGVSFHIFLQHRGWILLFRSGLTGGIPAGQKIGVVEHSVCPVQQVSLACWWKQTQTHQWCWTWRVHWLWNFEKI